MSRDDEEPEIQVEHAPDREELERRGVFLWEIWTKEASVFPWTYRDRELCYLLEGEVVVTPDGGEPVTIRAGDFVTFAKDLSCTWDIRVPVRKHYNFE